MGGYVLGVVLGGGFDDSEVGDVVCIGAAGPAFCYREFILAVYDGDECVEDGDCSFHGAKWLGGPN